MSDHEKFDTANTVRERMMRQAYGPNAAHSTHMRLPLTTSSVPPPQLEMSKVKVKNRFQHSQNNILSYTNGMSSVSQVCCPTTSNTQPKDNNSSPQSLGTQDAGNMSAGNETFDSHSVMQSTSAKSCKVQITVSQELCPQCNKKTLIYEPTMKRCLNCGMFSLKQGSYSSQMDPQVFYNNELLPSQRMVANAMPHNSNDQWKTATKSLSPAVNTQRRKRAKKRVKDKIFLTISSDEDDATIGKKNEGSTCDAKGDEEPNEETPQADAVLSKDVTENIKTNTAYKIPKLSDRMKPQGGKVTQDNTSNDQQSSYLNERPLLSFCSTEKKFDLSVKCIQLGSLNGKGITPLILQNNTLKIEVECSYSLIQDGKKKIMNEKYKLALSSVEVSKIILNCEEEPLMISVVPSKRYSDIVNEALSSCIIDSGNKDLIKRQIIFFIECDQSKFRNLLEKSLPDLQRIAQVLVYTKEDLNQLISVLNPQKSAGSREYSTRSKNSQAKKEVKDIKTLFVYPPLPQKGGIAITNADAECLAPGTYLNDTIIDFYLRYIYEEKLSEQQRKQTYIFSTYFYTRLSKKVFGESSDKSKTPAERMHMQVRKWTRDVDIFEKDFIIIPVNEHAHWFLVIICFPTKTENDETASEDGTNGSLDSVEEVQEENQEEQEVQIENREEKEVQGENQDESQANKNDNEVSMEVDGDLSVNKSLPKEEGQHETDPDTRDKAQKVDDESDGKEKDATSQQGDTNDNKNSETLLQPCILIFDSLVGGGRSRVFSNLRHYLTLEWKEKRASKEAEKIFTKNNIKGCFPKIPLQNNDCDCGIYILQFAESFFESPIVNYKFPIRKENWFTKAHVDGKRNEIQELIKELEGKYSDAKSSEKKHSKLRKGIE